MDTAKKPGEEKESKDEEDADCKEERGIDMSEDFDSKLQDVEKKGDDSDESEESDNDEEADKQMGETEENAERFVVCFESLRFVFPHVSIFNQIGRSNLGFR